MAIVTPKRPSYASLLVSPRFSGNVISTATGFVAMRPGDHRRWLITNWHVVTGRNPETGQPLDEETGQVPNELQVLYHRRDEPGVWNQVRHDLYDANGDPVWLEHPTHGRTIDVVALPISEAVLGPGGDLSADGVMWLDFYGGHDPWREDTLETLDEELAVDVARPVSIIGFPFGETGGALLPIWMQGWIASEPEASIDGLPLMYVDARTRKGQSGSPVIAYSPGPPHPLVGAVSMSGNPQERFVGVYSGRINKDSDIGRVWKRRALVELIDAGQRGPLP